MLFGETVGVYCDSHKQNTNSTPLNITTGVVVTAGLKAVTYVSYSPGRNALYKHVGNVHILSDHNNNNSNNKFGHTIFSSL
jgi:hypothetical protein